MLEALHLISRRGDDHLRVAGQQALWTPVVRKLFSPANQKAMLQLLLTP
jgi:hypothetical protein